MQGFNKVILAGNLTRDPELRYTPGGLAIAKFGLAINRKWKDQSGEQKEEVTFVDVDAFGKQAELIGQFLKKGRPLLVEGRLRLDSWEDKQTQQKRSRLGVVLESMTFLDSGSTREGGGGGDFGGGSPSPSYSKPARPPQSAPPPSTPEPEGMPPEEDDVPF
ncbi:MAG TPA: single-stranded DNA-binding protein [Verrucomicrobiae bacterium]|nr:single-stranded DNA-binding protein [Verrucomicrobiae bacterium]